MIRVMALLLAYLAVVAASIVLDVPPARSQPVDLALVLAMDVSGSIDAEEYRLQQQGTAAAFRAPRVVAAIAGGPLQAIAVEVVQWSGFGHQKSVIEWTRLSTRPEIEAFADAVEQSPRAFSDWTSISDAIDFSAKRLELVPWEAGRRVIDVSGDGINNNGRKVEDARDDAVAQGIVINGLPILNEDPMLGAYYADNVIGGPGAFVIPARGFDDFYSAIVSKLSLEIAGGATRFAEAR